MHRSGWDPPCRGVRRSSDTDMRTTRVRFASQADIAVSNKNKKNIWSDTDPTLLWCKPMRPITEKKKKKKNEN